MGQGARTASRRGPPARCRVGARGVALCLLARHPVPHALRLLHRELEPPQGGGRHADEVPRSLPKNRAGRDASKQRPAAGDRPVGSPAGIRPRAARRHHRVARCKHRHHAEPRPELRRPHRVGGRRPRAVEERRVLSSFRRRRAQVSHVLRELREGVARGPRGPPVPLGAPL